MASAQVQHDGRVIGSLVAPCFSTRGKLLFAARLDRRSTSSGSLPRHASGKPDIVPCALRAAFTPERIRGPAALDALLPNFFALQYMANLVSIRKYSYS